MLSFQAEMPDHIILPIAGAISNARTPTDWRCQMLSRSHVGREGKQSHIILISFAYQQQIRGQKSGGHARRQGRGDAYVGRPAILSTFGNRSLRSIPRSPMARPAIAVAAGALWALVLVSLAAAREAHGRLPRPFWSRTRTAQISLMKPYYNSVHEKQFINVHNDR
jgi:hypothetical protein